MREMMFRECIPLSRRTFPPLKHIDEADRSELNPGDKYPDVCQALKEYWQGQYRKQVTGLPGIENISMRIYQLEHPKLQKPVVDVTITGESERDILRFRERVKARLMINAHF